MNEARRVAVITGANRGLGFETGRQLARLDYQVVLTSRDALAGKAAADKLQSEGVAVVCHPLDISREDSIVRFAAYVERQFGRVDVLINNAGIFAEYDPEGRSPGPGLLEVRLKSLREHLETNALGALRLTQAILPLMRHHGYGRIVNLSTGYGQMQRMGRGFPAYRLSKAALNTITRMFAAETEGENILVNAVDPGWTRTRMGGPHARYSPAEAARWVIEAATFDDDGPSGRFLRAGQPIEW